MRGKTYTGRQKMRSACLFSLLSCSIAVSPSVVFALPLNVLYPLCTHLGTANNGFGKFAIAFCLCMCTDWCQNAE